MKFFLFCEVYVSKAPQGIGPSSFCWLLSKTRDISWRRKPFTHLRNSSVENLNILPPDTLHPCFHSVLGSGQCRPHQRCQLFCLVGCHKTCFICIHDFTSSLFPTQLPPPSVSPSLFENCHPRTGEKKSNLLCALEKKVTPPTFPALFIFHWMDGCSTLRACHFPFPSQPQNKTRYATKGQHILKIPLICWILLSQ